MTRRAFVTGGSSDIGAAICRELALAGCHVIVHANCNTSKAEATVSSIHAEGGSAEAFQLDLATGMEPLTSHSEIAFVPEPNELDGEFSIGLLDPSL